MKVVAISAGRKNGNNEILIKEAIMEMEKIVEVEPYIIRLSDINLNPCTGCEGCMKKRLRGEDTECVITNDDYRWLANQIKDTDALLVGAPIYDDIPSGNLIVLLNRGLGFGSPSKRTKVCATISVGGSDWIDFTEPIMDLALKNLAENATIVDRMICGDHPAPNMTMVDDEVLSRARKLGQRLANAFVNDIKEYQGDKGVCPVCNCNLLEPKGENIVMCPYCGSLAGVKIENKKVKLYWNENAKETERFSVTGRAKHRLEIKERHEWIAGKKDLIMERREKYMGFNPILKPE